MTYSLADQLRREISAANVDGHKVQVHGKKYPAVPSLYIEQAIEQFEAAAVSDVVELRIWLSGRLADELAAQFRQHEVLTQDGFLDVINAVTASIAPQVEAVVERLGWRRRDDRTAVARIADPDAPVPYAAVTVGKPNSSVYIGDSTRSNVDRGKRS